MKFFIHWARMSLASELLGCEYVYATGTMLWISLSIFEIGIPTGWMPKDMRQLIEEL